MSLSFIKWIRPVEDIVLFQYFNTEDDSVVFIIDDETQKTIFKIDSSGNTTFFDSENKEIQIGRFMYGENDFIKFVFISNFGLEIETTQKQFIEAEQVVINKLISDHNDYFKLKVTE